MMKRNDEKTKACRSTVIWAVLAWLFLGLTVLLATAWHWEATHWANLKMNEIVGQLATSVGGTSEAIMGEFYWGCLLPSGLVFLAAGAALIVLRKKPWLKKAARIAALVCMAGILGMAVAAVRVFEVDEYVADEVLGESSSYISENLVIMPKTSPASSPEEAPTDTSIEGNYAEGVGITMPEQKRNLIFIWLESMESTFADKENGGAFEKDRIPELTALAEENISFTGTRGGVNGGVSMAGSTWTMGALFAQTCGLPLKIPVTDSSMSSQTSFFPGVVTLGDILEENGYRQALLIGSDAAFGGRELYFTQHGNYEILDYKYSQSSGQIPPDYRVWWGYEDEKLFGFAKEYLLEAAKGEEPFNLTMLTADTHFPDGYHCPQCKDDFADDPYANVLRCSSRMTAEFVDWIRQQDFYENTTIVISGDHITMQVGCCDDIDKDYQRRVYTTVINPAASVEDPDLWRDYTTFDIFPTTLAALGARIPGERLGLGVNLFSAQQTLLERDGYEVMDRQLKKKSDLLTALSGINEEVFDLSQRLADLNTEMTMRNNGPSLTFSVHGLESEFSNFDRIEIFAESMDGNTRTTLWMGKSEWNGTAYEATMDKSLVKGLDSFTVNVYAVTENGRIKVDYGYTCNLKNELLRRLEKPAEGEE